jgi:hypothetical protein
METLEKFNPSQIGIINEAAAMAEELVSNFYKLSASQWLRFRYDIKTLADLGGNEIVHGPFAQVIRYEGKRKDRDLRSSKYDLYRICVQDHTILSKLKQSSEIELFPFTLYIITHELIHVIRFCKFLQNFDASPEEKMAEEKRVHEKTHEILSPVRVPGMETVLCIYREWRTAFDRLG